MRAEIRKQLPSLPGTARGLPASSLHTRAACAADQKLTEDDRVEILRGLLSEYATVKALSSALQETAAV